MSDYKTLFIVNPNSANKSTGREWPHLESVLKSELGTFDTAFTSSMGDATRITRERAGDYEMVVAVGGDGTNNEVINGFFDGQEHLHKETVFGFICRGTGGDFRRTFGWSRDFEDSVKRLKGEKTRTIDLGKFSYITNDGQNDIRYFINITSFGIGGLVDQYCNNSSKALGGKASFMIASGKALLAYKNKKIKLTIDDHYNEIITINSVSIANGRFFGGGMMIAPKAEVDDGLFDITIMGDLSKWEVISNSRSVYSGTHIGLPKISSHRGKKVTAIPADDSDVLLDVDGEAPGKLPATFEVLPGALKLKI